MMKLITMIKNRLAKQSITTNGLSGNQTMVLNPFEKIINPLSDEVKQQTKEKHKRIIHKVVLTINEKLAVYGVGEVTNYDLNAKGELVMSLSFYER